MTVVARGRAVVVEHVLGVVDTPVEQLDALGHEHGLEALDGVYEGPGGISVGAEPNFAVVPGGEEGRHQS